MHCSWRAQRFPFESDYSIDQNLEKQGHEGLLFYYYFYLYIVRDCIVINLYLKCFINIFFFRAII